MSDLTRRVCERVDSRREAIVATLSDLIRINTVNPYSGGRVLGSEKPGQLALEPRLRALGAATALVPVPADVYARAGIIGPADRDFTDRPNLVAEFDFGGAGPHVLVFGHMDTVAVDDMTTPPFEPVRRDGRIYGRGASDDKSGLAQAFHAVEVLLELGLPLAGRLTVASVIEEECNGGGAGVVAGHLKVPGIAAHAASADGVSALEKALVMKRSLDGFKADRETARPQGFLNIGVFRAGVHPAVVPGSAEMEFNVVTFLDETSQASGEANARGAVAIRRGIQQALDAAADADAFLAGHRPELTWAKDLPPFETPEDSPLLAAVCRAAHDVTGNEPEVRTMNGWTDAAYVPLLAGCEVVNLGCCAPGAAHAPDEYVEEETLIRRTKTLGLSLARLLMENPE